MATKRRRFYVFVTGFAVATAEVSVCEHSRRLLNMHEGAIDGAVDLLDALQAPRRDVDRRLFFSWLVLQLWRPLWRRLDMYKHLV